MDPRTASLVDANLNRAVEGVRVVEDALRFVCLDEMLCRKLKSFRHAVSAAGRGLASRGELAAARAHGADPGRRARLPSEEDRTSLEDVVSASGSRVGESLRVLEEAAKLSAPSHGKKFKKLRYAWYDLERFFLPRLSRARRLQRFREASLYVVLDSRAFPLRKTYEGVCRAALRGGATVIQLRDKRLRKKQLLQTAKRLAALCRASRALFIVNDFVEIALAVDADGVHLGQNDLPVREARKLLGPEYLIGQSTHSLKQLLGAEKQGADYASVGPVYATPSKPGASAVGLPLVNQAARWGLLPFVAIGGIDASNAADVALAGAPCLGVIRAVCAASNPKTAAKELVKAANRYPIARRRADPLSRKRWS